MKEIKNFFYSRFFSKELPFNYRIYMIFFFECLLVSVISATTNTLLAKGIWGILFQWSFIVFCIVVLFVPMKVRMAITKPLLVFVAFIYIPFLFFQTAGFQGTAFLFSVLAAFVLTVMFKGKERVAIIVSNLVLLTAVCTIQYVHPDIVIPHGNWMAEFLDYIVALTMAVSGIAILGAYVTNTFDEEQVRIHSLLKNVERTNEQLKTLTNRDSLTDTFNRRFLVQYLEHKLEANENICILMMDIDHFKKVNDTWGHGFGDEVLISFAKAVQNNLRESDVLARTGGEEFVVVLDDISLAKAKEIAERIRRSVSEIVFHNQSQITVSIGLVQAQRGEPLNGLLNRADKYLYDAKFTGRNRVISE